jgi:MiaB-like tRNA modifying enzyme
MKLVKIETYGCSSNKADSNIIRNILKSKYKITKSSRAGIIILLTCYVKLTTQNKMISRIKNLTKTNKKLIIAGCMPEIDLKTIRKIAPKAIVLGPKYVDKIEEAIKGKSFTGKRELNKAKLIKTSPNNIYTLKIAEGCNNICSFCCAKIARGNIYSFNQKDILDELKKAVKKYKIIHITAQDTAAYGLDKNKKSKLPELIDQITNIKGNFKIRIGMMNPSNVLPILKELINSYKNKKVIKFLHIPVQSGSDKVIKNMNRKYRVKDFKKIVNTFRREIPDIHIATDIMAGYPTETEKDFKKTLKLLKEIKPDVLNVSKFTPRPGTKAKQIKQLKTEIIKERTKKIKKLNFHI